MPTTIRLSNELKTELASLGTKEDTYEDIIWRLLKTHEKINTTTKQESKITEPEIVSNALCIESLEAMRQKWWDDKHIGKSIINAGGIGIINLKNIIQKNHELFETKEECRMWLYNKFKTYPPIVETETPKISTKLRKPTATNTAEEPPKFTPNRSIVKCTGCGEEQLVIPGSTPIKKCVNCGFIKPEVEDHTKALPDQHAPAQDVLPSPPTEAKL